MFNISQQSHDSMKCLCKLYVVPGQNSFVSITSHTKENRQVYWSPSAILCDLFHQNLDIVARPLVKIIMRLITTKYHVTHHNISFLNKKCVTNWKELSRKILIKEFSLCDRTLLCCVFSRFIKAVLLNWVEGQQEVEGLFVVNKKSKVMFLLFHQQKTSTRDPRSNAF